MTKKLRTGIFISYSHRDEGWREKVETFLRGALYGEEIRIWSDHQIPPGQSWSDEIEGAIASARVAILLVSANFLASPFIRDYELPRLLEVAHTESLVIYWIPISASNFEDTPLAKLQAASDPKRPLDALPAPQQRVVLAEITKTVVAAVNVSRVGNAFAVADDLAGQLNELEGQPLTPGHVHAVQARQVGVEISLTHGGQKFEQITAADLANLDENSQQLIRSWERSMQVSFDRWTERWPERLAQDPKIRERAIASLRNIKLALCGDLNSILNFVESMGKQLQDHYAHVRYLCSQSAP
jgi:TIR domain